MLSRIELLESQLAVKRSKANTSNSEETEQQRTTRELSELVEDRNRVEQQAKESLRAMLEQMQETGMKLHDSEMGWVRGGIIGF